MLKLNHRYDYFPATRRPILPLLISIHESIIKSVIEKSQPQLKSISLDASKSAAFAKEVESDGSATIDVDESHFGSHAPRVVSNTLSHSSDARTARIHVIIRVFRICFQ